MKEAVLFGIDVVVVVVVVDVVVEVVLVVDVVVEVVLVVDVVVVESVMTVLGAILSRKKNQNILKTECFDDYECLKRLVQRNLSCGHQHTRRMLKILDQRVDLLMN